MRITPEDQIILKKQFPKFSKISACYCNNPEYGVSLSPAAKDWLNRMKFAKELNADADVTDEQAKIIQKYVEEHFDSIKSLIKWMALQHEEPVHKELSEEDCAL